VLPVRPDGRLGTAVPNPSADAVPFAFDFDVNGHLAVISAGSSALTTYEIAPDRTLTLLSGPVRDTPPPPSWIAALRGGFFYVGTTGSAPLSPFRIDSGAVSLTDSATPTAASPIDLVASPDGHYLYSETGGGGTIDEFSVGANGALTPIGQITGLTAH